MSSSTQMYGVDRRADEVQTVLTRARVAVLRRDRATLEEVLAADYLCVYPDGRVLNKAERIRSAISASAQPSNFAMLESRDSSIRFYGSTAIVTEVIRQGSSRQGTPTVDEWVAVSVLHESEGRWQIVSGQLTSIRGQ